MGTRQRVLVEKDGFGHAENFAPVQLRHSRESGNPAAFDGKLDPRFRGGDVIEVKVAGVANGTLIGVPA